MAKQITFGDAVITKQLIDTCIRVLKFDIMLKPQENYLALFGLDKREFKFSA